MEKWKKLLQKNGSELLLNLIYGLFDERSNKLGFLKIDIVRKLYKGRLKFSYSD